MSVSLLTCLRRSGWLLHFDGEIVRTEQGEIFAEP